MNHTRNQSSNSNISIDPVLRLFHVGGRGPTISPAECLLPLGKDLEFLIFEADIEKAEKGAGISSQEDYEKLTFDYNNQYGVKISVMQKCISDSVGRKTFHINVMPECSSLLKISPEAANYSRMSGDGYTTSIVPSFESMLKVKKNTKIYTRMPGNEHRIVWGQICQPTRTVEMETTTLDELYGKNAVQLPHFLSLDIQGAEYDTLKGASKALEGDLMGVLTEVEFRELYENQKLFTDQASLLKSHQFSLFELYNTEHWYSGPILGKGALVVAEALFLRDFKYFVEKDKEPAVLLPNLAKLAIIAYSFERVSYAMEIMDYIMGNWKEEWKALLQQHDIWYMRRLADFYDEIKANKPKLERKPTYLDIIAKKGQISRPRGKMEQRFRYLMYLAYNVNLRAIVERLSRR
jgi:FkbM family methyltransferase